jgi:hypothetical protein
MFMVTFFIFKNHLLEVGLTQNHETMALRMLTTIDSFYFYHAWGPAWIENSLKQHVVEGLVTYDFTLHLRVSDHTIWFWRCVGMAIGLLSSHNFHGHGSWLVCEVALSLLSSIPSLVGHNYEDLRRKNIIPNNNKINGTLEFSLALTRPILSQGFFQVSMCILGPGSDQWDWSQLTWSPQFSYSLTSILRHLEYMSHFPLTNLF